MLVFRKFCLNINLVGTFNCHTGYFSSKISAQQRNSYKKLNVYSFVHIKTHPICIFTVIFVHLDVVIR